MSDEELQNTVIDDTSNIEASVVAEQETSEPEKVTFDEAQQKVFDTAIAKKGLQAKRSDMASQATIGDLNQRIADLQSKMPQSTRPAIPELTDQYDDDFQTQMATRDKAIQEAAAFDANQVTARQLQDNQALVAQQEQQKATLNRATAFLGRAEKLGINEASLKTALDTVGAYGGIGDVAEFVMVDDNGPLIAAYLADNPAEVLAIQALTPLQGVAHIVSSVTPKAIANKQTIIAPDPPDGLGGSGTNPSDEGPAGAVYE